MVWTLPGEIRALFALKAGEIRALFKAWKPTNASCNASCTVAHFHYPYLLSPLSTTQKKAKLAPALLLVARFARLKPLNVRFRSPCFIPFIHYLKACQAHDRHAPIPIRAIKFTKLTARLKTRCDHALQKLDLRNFFPTRKHRTATAL